jgi:hypothetical protein
MIVLKYAEQDYQKALAKAPAREAQEAVSYPHHLYTTPPKHRHNQIIAASPLWLRSFLAAPSAAAEFGRWTVSI